MIAQIEIIYILIVFLIVVLLGIYIFKIINLISFDRYIYILSFYGNCRSTYKYTDFINNFSDKVLLICINVTSINGNINFTVKYLVASPP